MRFFWLKNGLAVVVAVWAGSAYHHKHHEHGAGQVLIAGGIVFFAARVVLDLVGDWLTGRDR